MFNYMTIWPIEKMTGYKPLTTYWNDFETAEIFGGEKEIRALYKRARKNWSSDIQWITEICMVLNWRAHLWWERKNEALCKLYTELYEELDQWILECEDENVEEIKYKHFTKDEILYYLQTTD